MSSSELEVWLEYGFATAIIFLRMLVQIRKLGFSGLYMDDFLMPVAWLFLTAMDVLAVLVPAYGSTKVGDNATRLQIVTETPELAEKFVMGSKFFVVAWFVYTGFLWTMKLCMLFFLQRFTRTLWMEKFIMPLVYLVLATWLGVILIIFIQCRPFHAYWQIFPDPGPNCSPESHVLYIGILVLNLITDVCIVSIPLPILFRARITPWRRAGLMVLLSAGVFVIVAAILRVSFVLAATDAGGAAAAAIWATRETLVAVLAVNATFLLPLFKRSFWSTMVSHGSSKTTGGNPSSGGGGGGGNGTGGNGTGGMGVSSRNTNRKRFKHPLEMDTFLGRTQHGGGTVIDIESSSQERIVAERENSGGVHVKTEFTMGDVVKEVDDEESRSSENDRRSEARSEERGAGGANSWRSRSNKGRRGSQSRHRS